MELQLAEEIALDLIDQHLCGWNLTWNDKKRVLGTCHYTTKTITLSKTYTTARPRHEVRNTVLHEIAHALVGPGHGHGLVWQRQAVAIGAKPESKADTSHLNPRDLGVKWVMLDANDKIVQKWFRKPRQSTFDSMPFRYLKGRKTETIGTLRIVAL